MKFKGSLDIKQSREKVVAFYLDVEKLKDYQDGFVKKELISGEPAKDGTISKMYYKQGKRDMVLTETITSNQLPDSFEAFYHHEHMDNTMKLNFIELDENTTRYEYEFEYVRMNWIMPRLIAILFPSMYRNQGEKWMRQFKEALESI